jgi:hypothetical protein
MKNVLQLTLVFLAAMALLLTATTTTEAAGRQGQTGQGSQSRGQTNQRAPQGVPADRAPQAQAGNQGTCDTCAQGSTATPLTETEKEALLLALDDEYHAWAIYAQVIADFGRIAPFTRIQASEEQHIAALVRLFGRYQLPIPPNPWIGQVESIPSVRDACAAGVAAEDASAALYDRLFAATDRNDILRVFQRLHDTSLNNHLPAFERCAR